MDGWGEFLEARMNLIRAARKEGATTEEVESLINIGGMQTVLLCMTADERNREQATYEAARKSASMGDQGLPHP